MPNPDGNTSWNRLAEEQADHCRIFSNARRVMILWALMDGEMSVGEIAEEVGTTLQNISQHLHLMKDSRLVASRRLGQTVYYRLNPEVLTQHCLRLWRDRINPDEAIESTGDPASGM